MTFNDWNWNQQLFYCESILILHFFPDVKCTLNYRMTHIGPILWNRFKFTNIWNYIFKSRFSATKSELGQFAVRNVVENIISDTFLQECKVRGKYNISWKHWCRAPRAAPWQRTPAKGKESAPAHHKKRSWASQAQSGFDRPVALRCMQI